MKLGSLKTGGRDGTLVVVSRDLTRRRAVPHIAPTLQAVLDDWETLSPRLAETAEAFEADGGAGEPFDAAEMASPLPRAYHWADGSAYVNYLELVRRALGPEPAATLWTDPLIYQGGSDTFLGPTDDILVESEDWGIDFEAEVAIVTDDVPMGVTADVAKRHLKLFMLVNDVSLRGLVPAEQSKGFGYYQSKPSSAFSPVAVTPDELGEGWDTQKLYGPILSHLNGRPFGKPDTGRDMQFDLPTIVAHAAKTRSLGPGTIIGSGAVSNRQSADHGSRIEDGGVGHSCVAELRMIETLGLGKPVTPFLRFGDRVRIEMLDGEGKSIFGAIEQMVKRYQPEV